MSRDILLSLHPKWFMPIMQGHKIYEVRKRAPAQEGGFTVYLYCTSAEEAWKAGIIGGAPAYRMNGTVCGEFSCTSIEKRHAPWEGQEEGTGLTARQLCEYADGQDSLYFLRIVEPCLYSEPLQLSDFGMTRPPQSWCYLKTKE